MNVFNQQPAQPPLTVLSFGAGQDSTYILYKLILDSNYRQQVAPGEFIVVMSDTGDEHKATYQHVKFITELCFIYGIEFYFLTSDLGYHPNTWPDLISQLKRNSTIISLAMPRSCTDNLKIKPFYNFLNVYIGRRYYCQQLPSSTRNKTWIKKYCRDYGKIRVVLGIAKGEESRIKNKCGKCSNQLQLFSPKPKKSGGWMTICIDKTYPMITEGIDRDLAQEYIRSTGWPLPPPSHCQRCPFISLPALLWLYRFESQAYYEWVELEQAKLNKYAHLSRNLGVKGERSLQQVLVEAQKQYGHINDTRLLEYKMTYGHTINSSY